MSADPLAWIVGELERRGIAYMLAGSIASSFHGSPRTTHDIDVVISPNRADLDAFVRGLDPERQYVSEIAVDEAWHRRGMFNVVDYASGWKIDLILCKERAFSRMEFDRRIRVDLAGLGVWMATAEDTIIAKLERARTGESDRQLRDVEGILEAAADRLDRCHIARWVGELGLDALWNRVSQREIG